MSKAAISSRSYTKLNRSDSKTSSKPPSRQGSKSKTAISENPTVFEAEAAERSAESESAEGKLSYAKRFITKLILKKII